MQIHYVPATDMLAIILCPNRGHVAAEVAPDVVLDYNEADLVTAISIEHASKHADLSKITVAVDQWARPPEKKVAPLE